MIGLRIKLLCYTLALLTLPGVTFAQQLVRFDHLSTDQGLSQTGVNCILQDRTGFMWFGTNDGLNRYDGYSFTIFRPEKKSDYHPNNNNFTCLYEAKDGKIWIGTLKGGVNIYNPQTEKFTYLVNEKDCKNCLSNNRITAITEDRNGYMWIATGGGGLNRYHPETQTFKVYKYEDKNKNTKQRDIFWDSHHNDVWSLLTDVQGRLWIGTYAGLFLYQPQTDNFKHYMPVPNQLADNSNYIWSIKPDKKGKLLLGTKSELAVFDPKTGNFEHIVQDPTQPELFNKPNVWAVHQDRTGKVWCGTLGNGLLLMNEQNGQRSFSSYKFDEKNPTSITNDVVNCIYEDRSGVIWLGTNNGISKWDNYRYRFDHHRHQTNVDNSLINNQVLGFWQTSLNDLWIATRNGLDHFDRSTNRYTHYLNDPKNPKTIADNFVRAVFQDSYGYLWIGTNNGLDRMDLKTKELKHYVMNVKDTNSLSASATMCFFEDKNQDLWIGTLGGVSKYLRKEDRFLRNAKNALRPNNLFAKNTVSHNYIYDIHIDRNNNVLIATGQGLNMFNAKADTLQYIVNDEKDSTSLSHNYVTSILETRSGQLWLGTAGGLNLFDPNTGKCQVFKKKDGLPNDVIFGMVEDDNGFLWLSTNKGISKFDPKKRQFKNYTVGDGLQGDNFADGAYYKNASGEIFFGGYNGYNVFQPAKIKDNPFVPPVVLTDFKIFNESVRPGEESKLTTSISTTKEITLSYKDYVFSIDFSALHFSVPEKNQFAYRLEGLENNWNYTDAKRRYVTYTNLEPKTYYFYVKGSNSDGIWNEEGVRLKIVVTPPFWQTWWFRIMALVAVLAGAYVFYRSRIAVIEAQKRNLETLVAERTHEILLKNAALEQKTEEISAQRDEILRKNTELEQKTEEISTQRDAILKKNEEISELYEGLQTLSTIGQKITSVLALEQLIEAIHAHVNSLMDATCFGIGIYNPDTRQIEFKNSYIEHGEKMPDFAYSIDDKNRFAVYCFDKHETILMNNVAEEYTRYIAKRQQVIMGQSVQSIMYVPLELENKAIGVLTVQSYERNAYDEQHLTILRNLASYISIATDNAQNFRQLNDSKEIIEEKNKSITDSIRYAQRIQQAILPSPQIMDDLLGSGNYWVFYKPKDIVSGDFYWCRDTGRYLYLAVVDCTGHGVPGAFMSLIGYTQLNEIVNKRSGITPAELLETLHRRIKNALKQDSGNNTDGMDAAVCCIDRQNPNQLLFAGAKRPLYRVRDGKLTETPGARKSIGGRDGILVKKFENQEVDITEADAFYMFTDGFSDQNEGNMKRYGTTKFKTLLESFAHQAAHDQQQGIEAEWQRLSEYSQRDDIAVMMFRIVGS
jgi:ligand-binding sensor domain-containing protein/serine phosphatase RsbU (regulator of sigma subunit)